MCALKNNPMKIHFDFYGVTVAVESDKAALIDDIRRDFSYFSVTGCSGPANIAIEVRHAPAGDLPIPEQIASIYKYNCVCFDVGQVRYMDYSGRARCAHLRRENRVVIHAEDGTFMHELCYMIIHSLVGEQLDGRGLHRVHGLGFSFCGQGVLCLMPSGAGKTTLALHLMNESRARLISEDTPLADRHGQLHPFPLRLGVCAHNTIDIPQEYVRYFERTLSAPKYLIDIEYFKDHLATFPCRVRYIFKGERISSDRCEIRRFSKFGILRLLVAEGVIGMNVPQYLEFLLRFRIRDMIRVMKTIFKRSKAVLKLLRGSEVYEIILGHDREKNTRMLIDFLARKTDADGNVDQTERYPGHEG